MTKSKFSLWAVLAAFLFLLVSGLNCFILTMLFLKSNIQTPPVVILFSGIFLLTWIWLVFGELRTKMVVVDLGPGIITVRNFCGLGRKTAFNWTDFEGYKTSLIPSKYQPYEYLYLMKNGRKEIKISQFYHRNYSEIKIALSQKVKFIGKENFSYFTEIKEIFKK